MKKPQNKLLIDIINNNDNMSVDIDTPLYNLYGEYNAKITKVFNDLTLEAIVTIDDDEYQKFIIKLKDIEMTNKHINRIINILEKTVLGKIVSIDCYGFDQSGKLVGNIYLNNELINTKLNITN